MEIDKRLSLKNESEQPGFEQFLAKKGVAGIARVEEWALKNGPSQLLVNDPKSFQELADLLAERFKELTGRDWQVERMDYTTPLISIGELALGTKLVRYQVRFVEQGGEGREFYMECPPKIDDNLGPVLGRFSPVGLGRNSCKLLQMPERELAEFIYRAIVVKPPQA